MKNSESEAQSGVRHYSRRRRAGCLRQAYDLQQQAGVHPRERLTIQLGNLKKLTSSFQIQQF